MLQFIEFLAVISGGTFGVLLARRKGLDFVGVFAIACMTAFGGGTLRDLFLDRETLFWIQHDHYAWIIFALALVISCVRRIPERFEKLLYLPDALGLGLFSIVGTGYAIEAGTSWFIAVLLGTITGTFGGVIGDVVCNELPSLFRASPLYATCAFVGCWVYLVLDRFVPGQFLAIAVGISVIVVMRLIALYCNIRLPEFSPGNPDDESTT
ncbi:MAG: trimeric intracellular cation channel family protein [Planctomycetaceae bacterium]|nr:trimeric intracellular cation channel family protein [Planctomycetaceae bacterium]